MEEQFATEDTVQHAAPFFPANIWPELKEGLLNDVDRRLREMDASGIEMMVMSLDDPAVQAIPKPAEALDLVGRATTPSPAKLHTIQDGFAPSPH